LSIRLENIRLAGADQRPLFDGLSVHIPDNARVGILGTSKPGNNALLRLICGSKVPEEGIIRRGARVSWPIPLATFLVAGNTIAHNVRFIARLYGLDDEELPWRVAGMVELTEFVNTPLGKCPRFARARLAFALGIGLDFDTYLFDGSFAPVDKAFKERAAEISAEQTTGHGMVLAANVPAEVEKNCESVYVLEQGRAVYFAEVSEGVERFKQLLAAEKKKDKSAGGKREPGEEDDEDLGDVDIVGAAVADAVD
jgi:capsular polysaccharide transport system ATP-binding protein